MQGLYFKTVSSFDSFNFTSTVVIVRRQTNTNVIKCIHSYSLGITILELACNMELPRGGELWQNLREEKLPLEFTQGISIQFSSLFNNDLQ